MPFSYWIWSKILENLASIGYDPATAYTASYDWRLAYGNLEVRDQYFTRLKMVASIILRCSRIGLLISESAAH